MYQVPTVGTIIALNPNPYTVPPGAPPVADPHDPDLAPEEQPDGPLVPLPEEPGIFDHPREADEPADRYLAMTDPLTPPPAPVEPTVPGPPGEPLLPTPPAPVQPSPTHPSPVTPQPTEPAPAPPLPPSPLVPQPGY